MDWSFLTIPYITCLAGIIAATVTDIKKREVPDWVSYSMMALGLLFAAAQSIEFKDWTVAWSILGGAVGFGIGALLYYTGQWGGGDAKLLAGVGSVMTLPGPWLLELRHPLQATPVPFFILFMGLMILCGMVYGLVWMFVLIFRNWKRFVKLFSAQLKHHFIYRILVWTGVTACIISAIVFRGVIALMFLMLAALFMFSFYLIIAIKIAENEFMLKTVKAKQLTEGDWVVGGVKLGKKWIIPEKNIGATKEQIAILLKKAPNKTIIIKEGIPFVPSFLAAFLLAVI